MVGGLDEKGNLQGLHIRISRQSILAAVNPSSKQDGVDMFTFQGLLPAGDHAISYTVPNLLVEHAMPNPPVPPGSWRGVDVNQNAIYKECFFDELAYAAGKDPLEFRPALMADHPKSLGVLDAVVEKACWSRLAAKGVFRGLAVCKAFASYVAACAEVSVDNRGNRKIIASLLRPTPATLSIHSRSRPRSRAPLSMACRHCSAAESASRTAVSNSRILTATHRC